MLDPHNMLAEVHPDLARVLRAASQAPVPFQVTYGLRTLAAEEQAVASGHSQTLHSRHLAGGGGDPTHYGGACCAVDVTPLCNPTTHQLDPNGVPDFNPARGVENTYTLLSAQILQAAQAQGVDVQWGGDWITFKDWGHFQLPWEGYP